jgi:opacity protein-like surface antigen
MRLKLFTLISMVLVVLISAQATAEESMPGYARTGFFATGGIEVGVENSEALKVFKDSLNQMSTAALPVKVWPSGNFKYRVTEDPMVGFSLSGGYRFHERLSLEVAADRMKGDVNVRLSHRSTAASSKDSTKEKAGSYTTWGVAAELKAYLLTGRFQPYALAGAGYMNVKLRTDAQGDQAEAGALSARNSNDDAFMMRFGGGMDFYFTQHLALNIDGTYQVPFGEKTKSLDKFRAGDEKIISFRTRLIWRF